MSGFIFAVASIAFIYRKYCNRMPRRLRREGAFLFVFCLQIPFVPHSHGNWIKGLISSLRSTSTQTTINLVFHPACLRFSLCKVLKNWYPLSICTPSFHYWRPGISEGEGGLKSYFPEESIYNRGAKAKPLRGCRAMLS